ncbi:MAG: histidine kinase [Hyphomonadaceae bacterium]|nr:histidine kinase [Hyphomonadaceae bacterium]
MAATHGVLREQSFDSHERAQYRRAVLALTIGMWTFHFLLLTWRAWLADFPVLIDLLINRVLWTVSGVVICVGLFFILEQMRFGRFWLQVLITHVLVFAAGVIYAAVRVFIYEPADWTASKILDVATYWLWFFLAWTWTILALSYRMRVSREEARRLQAESLAHQAKLQALRYQLNPHFLFNTLNSIAALMLDRRIEDAELMLRKLSDFLRSGLTADPLADTPLKDELAQQETYLDIERVRFPGRIRLELNVPDALQTAVTPGFILQPLIENSVKYAVAASSDPVTISISARAEHGKLIVSVADDGAVEGDAAGMGVGLENVARRLGGRFGEAAEVRSQRRDPQGFETRLSWPLRFAT